jgi:hypothetical protein
MYDKERGDAVRRLLFEYLQSPSLRHLRDPRSIDSITRRIIEVIDCQPSVWRKWEGEREAVLRAAAECWIPIEDLRIFLNSLPGPSLTTTDVAQRLRAIHEEPYSSYPDEHLRAGCLDLYRREVAEGSELPAVIGALQEFVEQESERRREEKEAAYRERQKEEREALERRFLAGADCKWTPVAGGALLGILPVTPCQQGNIARRFGRKPPCFSSLTKDAHPAIKQVSGRIFSLIRPITARGAGTSAKGKADFAVISAESAAQIRKRRHQGDRPGSKPRAA